MLKYLLLLPIILIFVGLVLVLIQLIKLFLKSTINTTPIVDCSYECLNGSPNTIKNVSTKYEHRIRGSVRLSQGRIKSIDEIIKEKNKIIFP